VIDTGLLLLRAAGFLLAFTFGTTLNGVTTGASTPRMRWLVATGSIAALSDIF
jgi:hypothetical protein